MFLGTVCLCLRMYEMYDIVSMKIAAIITLLMCMGCVAVPYHGYDDDYYYPDYPYRSYDYPYYTHTTALTTIALLT